MTQEAHQSDILKPAVKEVIRIEDGHRIPELMRRAFSVCTSGRPGPVAVLVPEDVSHEECDFSDSSFWADPSTLKVPARRIRPSLTEVQRAAELIAMSKRPVVLAGGGVHLSGAQHELTDFAEENDLPVAHTLSGKGAIACSHPLSVGLFGRYSRIANDLIDSSDCLIVVGCKLGEIATKRYTIIPASATLIHMDISPEPIGLWTRADVGMWSDARLGLADLRVELRAQSHVDRSNYLTEILQRITSWRAYAAVRYEDEGRPINIARVFAELNRCMPESGILVADGGFASHWAGLLYDTKVAGRGFIADRGFASIGYGLPGALGAKLANPASHVVGVTGDGGLNMTIGGLETARRAKAAFTLVVINNAASGYVKALQHAMYGGGAYQSSDLLEVNYATVAEAYGCHGIHVYDPSNLKEAFARAFENSDAPTVIDVVVTRDPAQMLPGLDSRTQPIAPGDRPA